jgi:hypothetical protein
MEVSLAANQPPGASGGAGRNSGNRRDHEMATQQEKEAFLRGWRAAMEEVLAVLASEAQTFAEEERDAAASGEYKLPGSFALLEVRGSFKGRHDLLAWLTEDGPTAAHANDPALATALDALIDGRATDAERASLGLARLEES